MKQQAVTKRLRRQARRSPSSVALRQSVLKQAFEGRLV